jgi:hypothetical protein
MVLVCVEVEESTSRLKLGLWWFMALFQQVYDALHLGTAAFPWSHLGSGDEVILGSGDVFCLIVSFGYSAPVAWMFSVFILSIFQCR